MQSVPPQVVKAGVAVFLWWKSDDFSRWYVYQSQESDLEVLVRAMWCSMQAAHR